MRLLAQLVFAASLGAALPLFAQPAATPNGSAPRLAASTLLPPQLSLRRDQAGDAMPGAYVAWILVVLLGAGGILVVRRARQGKLAWTRWPIGPAGELRVVTVRALGSQSSLQVVDWNGKQYLLGCTPQAITVLDQRAAQPGAGSLRDGGRP